MISVRGARELFVWYRVEAGRAERARAEVDAMQRSLENRCPGLRARLLIRDDGPGPQTWMETYGFDASAVNAHPDGIDAATRDLIETAATSIRVHLDSDRHVEAFARADRS